MVIFFPMMFLSGAGLPLQLLPETLQKVSNFLPLTYVVRLIQGIWFGETWSSLWVSALVLVGMILVGAGLAARFFRWE
jgi:ABC-2 type transport system permease protein